MKNYLSIFIIALTSCSQKDTGTITIKETDSHVIKYAFADLKELDISDVHDSIRMQILFRNLTDTIYFSKQDQDSGSVRYNILIASDISDTSNFNLRLWCAQTDSAVKLTDKPFKSFFGRTVKGFAHYYIRRNTQNFYKSFGYELRITDTTLVIKFNSKGLTKETIESLKKNICITVSYTWSDTKCGEVEWCDYLKNSAVLGNPARGYIRSNCDADDDVSNPETDTIIEYLPYDKE